MTDPANPPVGGTPPGPVGSGAGGDGSGGTPPQPGSTVPYDTYRTLLDEKKRAAARVAELEEKVRTREAKDLEANGDFQKLLANERERNEKLTKDLSELSERETGRRKLAGVLGALQGNVDSKYYNLIPYDDVVIDPTTGNIDEVSVAKVVEHVRAKYPEIIKATAGPGLPTTHPQGGQPATGTIKKSEFAKLSVADMRKYKPAQVIPD